MLKFLQRIMPFYAVARGFKVGVYSTWAECNSQVKGYSKASYKKFSTHKEALEFIQQNGNISLSSSTNRAIVATKRKFSSAECSTTTESWATNNRDYSPPKKIFDNGSSHIPICYTDGACSNNGRGSAQAGFGVFWGDNHEDNVSKPVIGNPTNNRAEYMAVICALKQALSKGHKELIICTDSKLLINSITKWIKGWKRNGWKTSNGELVKNQDLLREMDELLLKIKVNFKHVAGHSGIYGNEMADNLAVQGAKLYKG